MDSKHYDIVIIGGGPAGSTVASIVKKYNPGLSVLILEKEKFPRDHIGESQLPGIGFILHEMGVWDKIEAANFPIKIGASYTWGKNNDLWDFDFVPIEQFRDDERPGKYAGLRTQTAWQVDRAIYDDILLRHAEELGAEVREETLVSKVMIENDRVTGLTLQSGETITGTHYVDGSGVVGILKRALGIQVWEPHELRNIAVWDYWEDAEWAVTVGKGATRVQVRSLPYGWIWFIPLGPTRTSIGLIVPADHYKSMGMSPEEIYLKAISEQETIARLTKNAKRRGETESCKDWSNLADRLSGENWFITGEAAGFADPILAAGMQLAHNSAREVAYTILELERGEYDAKWLRDRYSEKTRTNIRQHIQFAQYWYSANSCFSDLKEHCQAIASEAGFKLSPGEAWRWLSQGGFAHDNPGFTYFGSVDVAAAKGVIERLSGDRTSFCIDTNNVFELDISGNEPVRIGHCAQGRILQVPAIRRGTHTLPRHGLYEAVIQVLLRTKEVVPMFQMLDAYRLQKHPKFDRNAFLSNAVQALDAMVNEGWVKASFDPTKPVMKHAGIHAIRTAEESKKRLAETPNAPNVKWNL